MRTAMTALVFCVTALLALGMVMLYSASMTHGPNRLLMQLTCCGLGLLAGGAVMWIDYRHWKKASLILFLGVLVLLVLVLVPGIGVKVKGARRWFNLVYFSLQPSELAKVAVIIGLAHYAERYQRHMATLVKGVIIPASLLALLLGLIFVEPDRGSTILIGGVGAAMLLIAGVRWRYLVPPAFAALVGLGFSLWHDPMRLRRIFSWLNLEETKTTGGYQAYQAMLALGSGGWTGLGLGNGRQKYGFVPEHQTDFIFSMIGEELGLVATLMVLLAFVMLIGCGIYIARHARDPFGMFLAAGVTFLVGFQACINIGVVTSALPNKGMPLPFISYGGSNLAIMLFCIGLLLSVAHHAPVVVETERENENDALVAQPAA